MELKKIITLYLNFCLEQKTLSSKTTKAYGTDLTQFAEFSEGTFDKNVIIDYIAHLHKQFKVDVLAKEGLDILAGIDAQSLQLLSGLTDDNAFLAIPLAVDNGGDADDILLFMEQEIN